MNNPKSVLLGWGSLLVAAGTSYYFARKSINERRTVQEARGQRSSEKLDWRERIEKEEREKLGLVSATSDTTTPDPSAVSAPASAVDTRASEKRPS